jgi:hypothetical protein
MHLEQALRSAATGLSRTDGAWQSADPGLLLAWDVVSDDPCTTHVRLYRRADGTFLVERDRGRRSPTVEREVLSRAAALALFATLRVSMVSRTEAFGAADGGAP